MPVVSPAQVTTILKLLRDQLMFYCACIRKQPPIYSFMGGFIGASGYAGLQRAEAYLVLVRQALDNYTRLGVLNPPLLAEAGTGMLYLGSHTRKIITPIFDELMDVIRKFLKINIDFINHNTMGNYGGETIWLSRTEYTVQIANPRDRTIDEYTGKVECSCTTRDFDCFLEKYLSEKRISLTSPTPETTFNPTHFAKSFGRHLDGLVSSESRNRAARAQEIRDARDRSIEAGAGM
jgi:hypothetical protein